MLDLSPGAAVVLDGREWRVEGCEPQFGRVMLVDASDRRRMRANLGMLAHHPNCRQSSRTTASRAAAKGRQEPIESDLTRHQRQLLKLRVAHLMEVATGFPGGDPLRPGPDEPKPCYDPAETTLTQRRWAKVEELASLDKDQARLLGLERVSYRTLIRWEARRRRYGAIGCADDRWLRPILGYLTINEQVREAIYAVHSECLHRSRISIAHTRTVNPPVRSRAVRTRRNWRHPELRDLAEGLARLVRIRRRPATLRPIRGETHLR